MGIIDVKSLVAQKKEELKGTFDDCDKSLVMLQVAEDEASKIYVSKKEKLCKELGIKHITLHYDKDITEDTLLSGIETLNNEKHVGGIMVQLPLPSHINETRITQAIDPSKDIDGFTYENQGKNLLGDKSGLIPATPRGIMTILDSLNMDWTGKKAVIIGRSNIVGKPLIGLLLDKNMTVTICHSKTSNLKAETINADLVIVAIGKPKFITEDYIKEGAVVIDVGINRVNGKVVGDCDTENISKKALITSVPGGVGLTTVLSLIQNFADIC